MSGSDQATAGEFLRGRLVAVLNTGSGSCNERSTDEVRAIFQARGLGQGKIVSAAVTEIDAALEGAAKSADVLVVLGGDGTIRTAIEKLGDSRARLIPLPGGTMNMLPKALYGQRVWQEALGDTLDHPDLHRVSGGRAGEHSFFVAALLGAPTLWADAREAARLGHGLEAAKRAITAARRSLTEPLEYLFDDRIRGTAEAVAVVCPLISRAMDEDERRLEAAAIKTKTAAEALRLGFHALFDDWRADPAISCSTAKTITVTGHGRVPVILDGERVRMGRSVTIRFVPVAFEALVPMEREVAPNAAANP